MLQDKEILIVDDDTTLFEMYEEMIKNEGALVSHSIDGEDAIQNATENHPNFILLDIMLPKINGLEVLRRLKSEDSTKDIPVIVFSALNEEEKKAESLSLGAVECVAKAEVLPGEIIEKIKKYI